MGHVSYSHILWIAEKRGYLAHLATAKRRKKRTKGREPMKNSMEVTHEIRLLPLPSRGLVPTAFTVRKLDTVSQLYTYHSINLRSDHLLRNYRRHSENRTDYQQFLQRVIFSTSAIFTPTHSTTTANFF